MRKMVSVVLVLIIVLSFFAVPANAQSIKIAPHPNTTKVDTSYQWYTCIYCDEIGHIEGYFTEYTYYYTFLWARVKCPSCGYEWNTVHSQVENIHEAPGNEPVES